MGVITELSNSIIIASNNYICVLNKKTADSSNLKTLELPVNFCKSEDAKMSEINSDSIVCLIASKNEKFLAAATQDKRLIVWNVSDWSVYKEEMLLKRPMAIAFRPDSDGIIVADKNGDVYDYSLNVIDMKTNEKSEVANDDIDVEPGPEALLGHFSMLLDLAITNDGKFLITCDRDEKIRVSSYPNCYNIHTFCLGHTEFVSHIRLLPDTNDRLLSASGDGRLILWNYLVGEKLLVLDLRDQIEYLVRSHSNLGDAPEQEEELKSNLSSTCVSNFEVLLLNRQKYILTVSFYRLPVLLFYELNCSDERFSYLYSQKLPFPPLDIRFLEEQELLVFMDTSSEETQKNIDENIEENIDENIEENIDENSQSLAVLQFSKDYREVCFATEHVILSFQDYEQKLKPKNSYYLNADSLFKHNKFDNVADYQKKKQERLSSRTLPVKRKSTEL